MNGACLSWNDVSGAFLFFLSGENYISVFIRIVYQLLHHYHIFITLHWLFLRPILPPNRCYIKPPYTFYPLPFFTGLNLLIAINNIKRPIKRRVKKVVSWKSGLVTNALYCQFIDAFASKSIYVFFIAYKSFITFKWQNLNQTWQMVPYLKDEVLLLFLTGFRLYCL